MLLAACGGVYDKAVLMKSANTVDTTLPEPLRTYYAIWESYVADLDPSDSNQTFRATIEMVDGKPSVKGDPESPRRKYTVLGKEQLDDETWQENLPGARFFVDSKRTIAEGERRADEQQPTVLLSRFRRSRRPSDP